jgi:hypothetical protein
MSLGALEFPKIRDGHDDSRWILNAVVGVRYCRWLSRRSAVADPACVRCRYRIVLRIVVVEHWRVVLQHRSGGNYFG